MKKYNSVVGIVCASVVLSALPALAQYKEPANLPPESYEGLQFVDNKGCVYVRSGYAGKVTWSPRVDQRRRPLCSKRYAPTFGPAPTETEIAADKPFKNPLAGIFATRKPTSEVAEVTPEPVDVAPEPVVVAAAEPEVTERVQASPEPAPEPELVYESLETQSEPAVAEELVVKKKRPNPFAKLKESLKAKRVQPAPVAVAAATVSEAAPEPEPEVMAVEEPIATPEPAPQPVVVEEPTPAPEAEPEVIAIPEPEVIETPSIDPRLTLASEVKKGFYVNVETTSDVDSAAATSTWFRRTGHSSVIVPASAGATVLVGPFRSEGQAKAALAQATSKGHSKARITKY